MKFQVVPLSHEGVSLAVYQLDASREMPYLDKRPGVLVCPGGAYRFCSDREAEPIAMCFLAMGYHAFVLRYSLGENALFPQPLQDVDEAFAYLDSHADELHLLSDKIAICGFSAGGHLAAASAVMGGRRPAAQILGYPCINRAICESEVLINREACPPVDVAVDASTPPAFIFTTSTDDCVPVKNALDYAAALAAHKIDFELHVFEKGGHGLATGDYVTCGENGNPDFEKWVPLCKAWLKRRFID